MSQQNVTSILQNSQYYCNSVGFGLSFNAVTLYQTYRLGAGTYVNISKMPPVFVAQVVQQTCIYYYIAYVNNALSAWFGLFSGIIGLIGGILSLLIMTKNPAFKSVGFLYLKAIILVEFCQIPARIGCGISMFYFNGNLAKLGSAISNNLLFAQDLYCSFLLAADLISIIMGIDRCIAVFLPNDHKYINTQKFAVSSILVSISFSMFWRLLRSLALWLRWWNFTTGLPRETINDVIYLLKGICLFILCCILIVGIMLRHWRRRKLKVAETTDSVKLYQCVLLCLTTMIPQMLVSILFCIRNEMAEVLLQVQTSWLPENYLGLSSLWIANICLFCAENVLTYIAHDLHFYLYFAFNRTFRIETLKYFNWSPGVTKVQRISISSSTQRSSLPNIEE